MKYFGIFFLSSPIMKHLLLAPFFLLFCIPMMIGGLTACEKDPDVITKIDTVIIVDTLTIVDIQDIPDTITTFILVRHAETTGVGNDPSLSTTGFTRAAELTRILAELDLKAVYSTNFNRTMQTAQPVAADQGLSVTQYDAFSPNTLIDNVINSFPEGAVLVVGHSNTTASMLNALLGSNVYPDLPETEYDNLFIVNVKERGDARVTHLKY
jgi:2,3-bisphosphoglycerate-dependent phosphoglycerate mutase